MNTTSPRVAVIMAGGKGERFWPQSRQSMPKQFLSLTTDGKTLFQLTVARMRLLTAIEHIFVVTNEAYCDIIVQQEPEFLPQNILCEPCAKNTAPAIAFAAAVVKKRYKDATMFVVPSDHIIHNRRLYTDIMGNAANFAENGENLVTLGITPTYPETGYGYINFSEPLAPLYPNVYRVARFVEKPTLSVAEKYIDDGSFLWNSGMFIWRSSSFLKGLAEHYPPVEEMANKICEAVDTPQYSKVLHECFEAVAGISIDYALLEKAENVYTIPSSFSWNDVGSWRSIDSINSPDLNGNVALGKVVATGSKNSVFISNGRLIAAVGADNLVVVEMPDVVLVCAKENAQDVKKIVGMLKEKNMTEYL